MCCLTLTFRRNALPPSSGLKELRLNSRWIYSSLDIIPFTQQMLYVSLKRRFRRTDLHDIRTTVESLHLNFTSCFHKVKKGSVWYPVCTSGLHWISENVSQISTEFGYENLRYSFFASACPRRDIIFTWTHIHAHFSTCCEPCSCVWGLCDGCVSTSGGNMVRSSTAVIQKITAWQYNECRYRLWCGENSIFWGYNFSLSLSVSLSCFCYVKILQSVTSIIHNDNKNKYLHFSTHRVYFKQIALHAEIF